MTRTLMERRRILLAISRLALLSPLAACAPPAGEGDSQAAPPGDSDLELLASVAYDLFPYPDIPVALYIEIGERLLAGDNEAVTSGIGQLREAAGNMPWKELDESRRVAILTGMEDSAFFATLRATSIEVLYRSEEVFAMVGYGGSAIEQGGYLNRGFDTIDWLPETD